MGAYSPATLVREDYPALMEEDAKLHYPSRALYARAVQPHSEAVQAGRESWHSTWVGTVVPLLLAIFSVVDIVSWVIYNVGKEEARNQAMFQAVVQALRMSNQELDEE